MVQQLSILKGHTVREALLTQITYLRPEDTMARVVELILSGTEKDFVVAEGERPVGVLYNRDIIKNSNNRAIPVKKIMKADFKVVPLDKQLTDILRLVETERTHFFPVVSSEQKLLGAVDMTNISEFILLQSKLSY